jgi:hypothetical protein
MIHAECRTGDNARWVEFDATPWFEEVDARSIILLAERDWSTPWVADALETRPGYEQLSELIRYARERLERESREDPSWPTFECRINGSDALAWLDHSRPEVAERIRRANKAGDPVA